MKFMIEMKGTSPLLMHNPRMVDPDFDLNRQIKLLTAKRKKTDEDLKNIEKLEWYGGLYVENGIVVQPSAKVKKSLVNAAKISKQGKSIERALSFTDMYVPLIYDGPKTIDDIFNEPRFHSRLSVGIGGKRVMRVRPSFFPWALQLSGVFIQDAGMNLDELLQIVELAGVVEGIGDNRINGYGRYNATFKEVK